VVLGPRAMKRLIMNPVSGDDQPNAMKLPDIVAAMEAEDIRADLAFTKPDEPALIAQRAVEEGYDMVVVGGGDGTVSEVAVAPRRFRSVLYLLAPIIISPAALTCRPIWLKLLCAGARSRALMWSG